ncbi:MAG: hypothetical protein V4574_10745 [Pseudomonadota bacterium]
MKPAFGIAASLPLLLLGACYYPHGITMQARDLPLPSALAKECVTAAIARAPGASRVSFWGSGHPASGSWNYRAGRERAWLSIDGSSGEGRFANGTSVNAGRHSTARLDAAEPVLLAVNRELQDCGLPLEGRVSVRRYRGRYGVPSAPGPAPDSPSPGPTP